MLIKLLALVGLLYLAGLFGWVAAHMDIARECERLGGFYVGKRVFRCTLIEVEPSRDAPLPAAEKDRT